MMGGDVMHSITPPYHRPWIWILGLSLWSQVVPILGIVQGPFENPFKVKLSLLRSLPVYGLFLKTDLVLWVFLKTYSRLY